jgi:predicted ABC-type ATPase
MPKTLEIIGGPNGSGKTTFAESALLKRKDLLYLNTDAIARGLTLNGSKYAQFEAGRVLLKYVDESIKDDRSFSFETTMSGRIWMTHISKAKKQGYKIVIYFVFVNSVPLSLKRIKNRVKFGGHNIPEEIVKRRFKRTFANFSNLYSPMADEWFVLDNSSEPVIIAQKEDNKIEVFNKELFNKFFNG